MSMRRGIFAVPLFTAAVAVPLAFTGGPAQATSAPAAAKRPVPAVATYAGPKIKIYGADGKLQSTRSELGDISLSPGLLVGTSESTTDPQTFTLVGVDPATGAKRFTVPNGSRPLAVGDDGQRTLFLSDPFGDRDPQNNSVWIRDKNGIVRRVVQFSDGPGKPGYDPRIGADAMVLEYSVDRAGRTMAVADGNEVDTLAYDVFAVDVAGGKVTRVTSGRKSRFPTISNDGTAIAYNREVGSCGDVEYRAADLVLAKGRNFATKTTLLKGSCKGWFSTPQWVSPRTLVAYRNSRVGKRFTSDLVAIDVLTRKVYPLTALKNVFFADAGRVNNVVAYARGAEASTSTVLTLSISSRKGTVSVSRKASVTGMVGSVAGANRA